MTNKTEDRFYFGKHGQPERFERRMTSQELGHLRNWISNHARNTDEAVSAMGKMQRIFEDDPEFWEDKGWSAVARAANVLAFSRPGKPDEFDLSEACWDGYEPVGTKRKDGRTVPNCVPMKNEKPERFASKRTTAGALRKQLKADGFTDPADWEWHGIAKADSDSTPYWLHEDGSMEKIRASRIGTSDKFAAISKGATVRYSRPQNQAERDERFKVLEINDGGSRGKRVLIQSLNPIWQGRLAPTEMISIEEVVRASRPGQPEKFDASSLDRKGFAAASASPMLGKLLSEKQMPEGGWRAVETGGGALVISFEDGDVAGNFARRVASNGYSATAPVQSIGRYWNVEVKNG